MNRAVYVGSALVALVMLLVGAASWRIQTDVLSRVGTDQLSRSLGFPVEIGAVSLQMWPVPSVLAADLRVSGVGESKPLLTADSVRFELGWLALLSGSPAIQAATLKNPVLTLELAPIGLRLPARAVQLEAGAALQRIRVSGGTIVLGEWKVEEVAAEGRLTNTSAELDFTARIEGLGPLGSGRVELTALDSAAPRWKVTAEADTLDAEKLAQRAAMNAFARGGGTATLRAEGEGETIATASAKLALSPLDVRSDTFDLLGDVGLELSWGGGYRADLSQADVKIRALLDKPIGVAMQISGALPASERPSDPFAVRIGEREASGDLRFMNDGPALSLSGEIDAALLALEPWNVLPKRPTGVLVIEQLAYAPGSPLVASGVAEGLEVELGSGQKLGIDGHFAIEGSSVRSRALGIRYLGQPLVIAGSYDTAARSGNLDLQVQGADLAVLTSAIAGGEPQAFGRLYLRTNVVGSHEVETLKGAGAFELPGGAFKSLSFAEIIEQRDTVILEEDMPPPADKPFSRVDGQFEIRDGQVVFSAVGLEQGGLRVAMKGTISLIDGQLNLGGVAIGDRGVEQSVRIGGHVWSPFVELGEWMDPSSPEGQKNVRTQITMLQATLEALEKRGSPSPEMRGEFERMREGVRKQMRARRAELTGPFEAPPNEEQPSGSSSGETSADEDVQQ